MRVVENGVENPTSRGSTPAVQRVKSQASSPATNAVKRIVEKKFANPQPIVIAQICRSRNKHQPMWYAPTDFGFSRPEENVEENVDYQSLVPAPSQGVSLQIRNR